MEVPTYKSILATRSRRLAATLAEMTVHTVVASAFLLMIWLLETVIALLWGDEPKLLWDAVPLKYVFDTMDVVVLGWFLIHGSFIVIQIYSGERS